MLTFDYVQPPNAAKRYIEIDSNRNALGECALCSMHVTHYCCFRGGYLMISIALGAYS